MSATRLFFFLDPQFSDERPFAVVEVPDTGDDDVDERAALDRFAEHYLWDPRAAMPNDPYNRIRLIRLRPLQNDRFCPLPRT